MFDFKLAEEEIASNPNYVIKYRKLISKIIHLKKFQFDITEIDFDISELIKRKSVTVNGDTVLLNQDYMLFYIAHKTFMGMFSFSFDENISSLFDYLKRVNDYFDTRAFLGKHEFIVGINGLALFYFLENYELNIDDFSKSWVYKSGDNFIRFVQAFNHILHHIKIENSVLIHCLRQVYTALDYNKPNIINGELGQLNIALKKYSTNDVITSKTLLSDLFGNFDELSERLAINVLAGIIEIDKSYLKEVSIFSKNPLFQPLIVCALRFDINYLEADLKEVLSIVQAIDNSSERYLLQLPRFYQRFIDQNSISNQEFKLCFEQLQKLIVINNKNITIEVLTVLRFANLSDEHTTNLLIAMISAPLFDVSLTEATNMIFFKYENCDYFFRFIENFGLRFKFQFNAGMFSNEVYELRNKDREKFDTHLVQLLIHDLGEMRIIGTRIFSDLSSNYNQNKFETDILKLTPKEQFKLFTSILSLYLEPNKNLPFLLPLFDSPNEFVKEAFCCRLELIAEDYGSSVFDVLKEFWNPMTTKQSEIYERIMKHSKDFGMELNKKMGIKELDPYHTQYKYVLTFNNTHQKLMQKTVNETADKTSIFRQIATTVILAKGGGWKHKETAEISQLKRIGTSMLIPRGYMVDPDNYEWQKTIEQLENWSKFLEEWEAIL